MNTDTQIFPNNFSTIRTLLRSPFGIDFDECSTGAFSLVGYKIKELGPCCIVYIFVKNSEIIFNHLIWFEIFYKNEAKLIDYLSAEFMEKVLTLVANTFIESGKILSCFIRPFFS